MKIVTKENLVQYDSKLKEYIDNIIGNPLDLLTYGVQWKPNVADPHLTRVGNMTYHRTLPILNGMKGCIVKFSKDSKPVLLYYLNEDDWSKKKNPTTITATITQNTDTNYFLVTDDVFSTNQYLNLKVYIKNYELNVVSIDTENKTASISYHGALTSGNSYTIELGAVLNGYDGEVMVEVPEFWIKSWDTDTNREVRISPTYIDDTWEHQAAVYISPYKVTILREVPTDMGYLSTLPVNSAISVVNINKYCRGGNNNADLDLYVNTIPYKSNLNKPATNIPRANMRTYCRLAGKEILSYLQYKRIMYWLYVIEYANFNCSEVYTAELTSDGFKQGGLGMGVTTVNGNYWSYYNSYNPLIFNGRTNNIGNNTGILTCTIVLPTTADASSTTPVTLDVPRWHGIENPFGDIITAVDGVIISVKSININGKMHNNVYATDDPALYSDSDYLSMKKVGIEINENSYVKEWDLGNTAEIIPRLNGGNKSQYKCAYHNIYDSTGLRILMFSTRVSSVTANLGNFGSSRTPQEYSADCGYRSSCLIK